MNPKIKVLMVDDEAQFRATTERILKRRGFQTIMAASGEEAIEKLDQNPDVVVLDIKMPGMDGHATTPTRAAGDHSNRPRRFAVCPESA